MSLSSLLGIDKSVDHTSKAAADLIDSKIDPLIEEATNRIYGAVSTALDRLNGVTIEIPAITIKLSVPKEPKATKVE